MREQITSLINEKINENESSIELTTELNPLTSQPLDLSKDLTEDVPKNLAENLSKNLSETFDLNETSDLNNLKTNAEIELKLRLASRYIDIQDKEQAASLLKDVIALGSTAEKMFAEKLLLNIQCPQ